MPTYDYNCQSCGNFELVQRIVEDAIKTCPTCGGPVKRLVSAAAFHLKGGGWYKTDYASTSSSANAHHANGKNGACAGETSTCSESAEKTPSEKSKTTSCCPCDAGASSKS